MADQNSEATPAAPPVSTVDRLEALLQSDAVKALLAAAEPRVADYINRLPGASQPGTPGWKTSEFWCLVVFFLLSLASMLADVVPARYALVCQAVSVGLYQISRGLTKHGTGN